jgi:putative transposase
MLRYIELNPVAAGMVRHPGDYRWSSYAGSVGGRTGPFLRAHPAYDALGIDDATRAGAYAALFDLPLDDKLIEEIRKATRGGHVAGAPRKPRGRPKQGLSLVTGK